jgi:hypothetical protein
MLTIEVKQNINNIHTTIQAYENPQKSNGNPMMCIYLSTYICVHMNMYTCIYVYMYICIYVYMHI